MSVWLDRWLTTASASACSTPKCARRLCAHLLAGLVSPCRGTITNLICLNGLAQRDWTADYRLYSRGRVEPALLFRAAILAIDSQLSAEAPFVAAIDDTLVRKCGTKIHGVGWKRDPLGPAFQTNLVRGQRYLQLTAAWPGPDGRAYMLPVDFTHAPTPPKPSKKAPAIEHQQYKQNQKQQRLNVVTQARLAHLRQTVPAGRRLVIVGDGSFTNEDILKGRPQNTVYIGRIRKDAVLHALPEAKPAAGRPPSYGNLLPTPEALRLDDAVPWRCVKAFAAGKQHDFKVKTIDRALWRKAGADCPVRLIVISPIGYRLRNGSRLLYRQPAFIISTDPDLSLEDSLQFYLWRWGIEVNFRDEKTLLGTGEAQVRTAASNRIQPAVTVAAYSFLWLAALQLNASGKLPEHLHPPKWRRRPGDPDPAALTTANLVRALRSELWSDQLDPQSFSHFTSSSPPDANAQKPKPSLSDALLTAA